MSPSCALLSRLSSSVSWSSSKLLTAAPTTSLLLDFLGCSSKLSSSIIILGRLTGTCFFAAGVDDFALAEERPRVFDFAVAMDYTDSGTRESASEPESGLLSELAS